LIEVSYLLSLKPLTLDQALAVAKGERLTDWAPDYPQAGDAEIANYLIGRKDSRWPCLSHYQIFDQQTQQVIGGIGYWERGRNIGIELGYSVVPSRRNAGVATDALRVLTAKLRNEFPNSQLFLRVEQKNEASLAVATKAGFSDISLDFDMCTLIISYPD
jgi:RimJ/RimL family protein N-acetyltransferase